MKEMNSVLVLAVIVTLIWFLNAVMRSFEPKANSPRSVRLRLMYSKIGSWLCWHVAIAIAVTFCGIPLMLLMLVGLISSQAGIQAMQFAHDTDLTIVIGFFLGSILAALVVRSLED